MKKFKSINRAFKRGNIIPMRQDGQRMDFEEISKGKVADYFTFKSSRGKMHAVNPYNLV